MSSVRGNESWGARAARNQSVFRAINEELSAANGVGTSNRLMVACECADVGCVETIAIDVQRYAEIRSDAKHFVVLAGHVYEDVERVIWSRDGYQVVEKTGEAGLVAAASNGSEATA
jgi:hypothetical protein